MKANKREKTKLGLTAQEFFVIFIIYVVATSGYRIFSAWRHGGDVPDEIGRMVFGLVMTGIAWLIYLAVKRRRSSKAAGGSFKSRTGGDKR